MMDEEKRRKRNVRVSIALAILLGGIAFFMSWHAEEIVKRRISKLEKACADLTNNDPDGKVYEPIVGRFLGSKSYTGGTPSGVPGNRWDFSMMFEKDDVDKQVFIGSEGAEFPKVYEKIVEVIGKDYAAINGSRLDTNFEVGVCAYASNAAYIGVLNTLIKMQKGRSYVVEDDLPAYQPTHQ